MSILRLGIAIAGSLVSLAAWLPGAAPSWAEVPGRADIVVIDNHTQHDVHFSLEHAGKPDSEHVLLAGQVLPISIDGKTVAVFQSDDMTRRQTLQGKSIYSFHALPGGLDLEKTNFPKQGQALRPPKIDKPPKELADRKPPDFRPSRVIPIKILVDEEQKAAREKWEKDLRRTVKAASDVIERTCGLRFEVQSIDTWQSDNKAAGPGPLLQDFELKVDPRPAWLAIGFTSQQRAARGQAEQHPPRLFARHIVVRDWTPKANDADRVEMMVHLLGHYLGAMDSPEALSVMRPLTGNDQVRAQKIPLQFDALNTLLLNIVADRIRSAGPAEWGDLPLKLQRQLSALWTASEGQPLRLAAPRRAVPSAKQPRPATDHYSALFVDGTRVAGGAVYDWGRKSDKPLINNQSLLDGPRPVRWLRDDEKALPLPPPAFVELVDGDRMPGKVVQYHAHEDYATPADGGKAVARAQPAHLVVEAAPGSVMHRADQAAQIRVLLPWLRRIVWERSGNDRYEPGTLRLRSGGVVRFRSLQFAERGVKLLMQEGVEQFPFAEIAEVHLPPVDPWQAYFGQLAVLSPDGRSRLVRWETTSGLRVTASVERFQSYDGGADRPDDWIHMLQPAWSMDPIYARHQSIWLRSYFLPTEFPLSNLQPVASQRKAIFSGAWDWRTDRNCHGGAMRCGREEFGWGFGVHATSELQFELPALATGLRTRVGLDRLAGRGGCVRGLVFVSSSDASTKAEPGLSGTPLFRSKLLMGSRSTQDSGTLSLDPNGKNSGGSAAGRRLVLLADMVAGDDRPSGADPLDVRDTVDWIEPLLELDREQLQQRVDQYGPRMIDAWAGWKLTEGELRLASRWDKSEARHPAYRLDVLPQSDRLSLERSWQVTSITHRLQLGVTRSRESTASQIEVLVNGERIGRFAVPVQGAKGSAGRSIPLGKYLGQRIAIQVNQISRGERPQVEWQTLSVLE